MTTHCVWPRSILNVSNTKAGTNKTRSSATAEKQCGSCACIPRLANWPDDHAWQFSAQNTAESQRQCYFFTFKLSDSKSLGRKRILTWNIHSRSFILQSVNGTQLVAYRYNIIACRISKVFEDLASYIVNRRILLLSTTPLSFDAPAKRNTREYPHKPYISRN